MTQESAQRRVLAVDDAEAHGSIYRDALSDQDGIVYLGVITHDVALDRPSWEDVDLVLLDLGAPEVDDLDEFPGAAVADRIRRLHPRRGDRATGPTIVVVTNHYDDPGPRIRCEDAGVDYFYDRAWVQNKYERVRHVVLHPDEELPRTGLDEHRRETGLVKGRSNDFVNEAREAFEQLGIGPHDLDRGRHTRVASRSTLGVLRSRLSKYVKAANLGNGEIPAHGRDGFGAAVPSITQVKVVLDSVAKAKPMQHFGRSRRG